MKTFYGINVYAELNGESFDDPIDIEIQIEDSDYEALEALAEEYRLREEPLTEEAFEKEMPELYQYISDAVDAEMPNQIDIDEDEDLTIDDFSWWIDYPEDLCEYIIE